MSGKERSRRPARRAPTPPDARETPPGGTPAPVGDPAAEGIADAAEPTEVAAARTALRRMGETARALGLVFGFDQDVLASAEAFDRVEGDINRTVEEIAGADDTALREAFALFGADLELDLSLTGLDPSFDPVTAELRAGAPH